MKKTLLALTIATLAATSAQATVIYQKDGTKVELDGRAHFELRNDKGNRTDLRDVGSRVRFRAYQEIGGGFSALAATEFRFSNDNGATDSIGGNLRTHRIFGGFMHPSIGQLTFGRQLHLGDHIPKANYTYEWGGNVFFDAHKKVASFMSVPFGGVRFAVDYYFGASNKTKTEGTKTGDASSGTAAWDEGQGYGVGLFYDGKWDNLTIRVGSGYTEVTQSDTGFEADEYKLKRGGIGFDMKYDIVSFGVDWAYGKATQNHNSGNIGFQKIAGYNDKFNENNRFLVGLKVDVTPKNAIYSQYYFAKAEKYGVADNYKMRGWMIGADHRFTKNVAVYLEGGKGEVKHAGETIKKNHRILAGLRILF